MNELRRRQLIENMIETLTLMERFKTSPEPNVRILIRQWQHTKSIFTMN